MRFLADENIPAALVTALREHGHDITAVAETMGTVEGRLVVIGRDQVRVRKLAP